MLTATRNLVHHRRARIIQLLQRIIDVQFHGKSQILAVEFTMSRRPFIAPSVQVMIDRQGHARVVTASNVRK